MSSHQGKRRKLSPYSELIKSNASRHEAYSSHSTPFLVPRNPSGDGRGSQNSQAEHTQRDLSLNGGKNKDEDRTMTITKAASSEFQASPALQSHRTPSSTGSGPKHTSFHSRTAKLLEFMNSGDVQRDARAEALLRKLKEVIERTPEQKPTSIEEAEKTLSRLHRIAVPITVPTADTKVQYQLCFAKPPAINVVGSHALKVARPIGQALSVDLAVTIPSSILSDKDFLDYRYLHKRAFYLACIAAQVKDNQRELNIKAKYFHLHGNPLLPALLIQPMLIDGAPDSVARSFTVHVFPVIPADTFPLRKLLPDNNCIRWKMGRCATPFYNATIRSDICVTPYLKFLHSAIRKYPFFKDGYALGRAWLQSQGLNSTLAGGGFGAFEWMTVLAILLRTGGPTGKPVLLPTYDGVQLLQATLQFLAIRDLEADPFHAFDTPQIQCTGGPMFFDGTRGINIFYKMTSVSYQALRHEAHLSLRTLHSNSNSHNRTSDRFMSLFDRRTDLPLLQYDMTAYVPFDFAKGLQGLGQDRPSIQEKALEIRSWLKRGLGDRVDNLNISWPQAESWTPALAEPPPSKCSRFEIKMSLDAKNATRVLDRGPSVEDSSECAAFREFWGGKTELRRFKDGTMKWSVMWTTKEPAPLTEDICRWIISLHLGPDTAKTSQFQYLSSSTILPRGENEYRTASDQVQAAYKDLEDTIRGLKELPLHIRSLQPSSSLLSSTSLGHPIFDAQCAPADVVLQLESSGQWPDDLKDIQLTKTALLLRMANLLAATKASNKGSLTCRIGLENPGSDFLNRSFLDVTYATGIAFRIRLHHEREYLLLKRNTMDEALSQFLRESSAAALAAYRQVFIESPRHRQAITRAASHFAAFPGSVRLLRAWVSSHLLSNHIREELLELLAVNVFIHPGPWARPATPLLGFLRIIMFLSSWDWAHTPLVVDFTSISGLRTKGKLLDQIRTGFEARRTIDPTFSYVAMIAATDFDTDGTTWTADARPSRLVASRLVALAKSAYRVISEAGFNHDIRTLFTSRLRDYDFILHVSPKYASETLDPEHADNDKRRFKNLSLQTHTGSMGLSHVDMFVNEIEKVYSNAIVLFHSGEGQFQNGVIAGVFNPGTTKERWKANLDYASIPLGERGEEGVELDRISALNEIARIGGSLISFVEDCRTARQV